MKSSDEAVVLRKGGRYKVHVSESVVLIFEKTRKGVLTTSIDKRLGVLDQEYVDAIDMDGAIMSRVPDARSVVAVDDMTKTVLERPCKMCGTNLVRELDFAEPYALDDVPVVPIFRCGKCDKRYYSMTKEYLSRLVDRNNGLFSADESGEIAKDREKGINTLNEYIIRIFASKKISRA